eukprot:gb/GECG01012677.1/.p1 GENE.gb/GECG01012677.1/~~gb/GECG01012677.1/.p1  ORF type:complete len:593 (+),score=62.81 gb/GECG01012677.1/:1-1779(+)
MQNRKMQGVRMVATMLPVDNYQAIAAWLNVPPSRVFLFSNSDRVYPIPVSVRGYTKNCDNPFLFARSLNFSVYQIIEENFQQQKSVVFCATRTEVRQLASLLARHSSAAPAMGILAADDPELGKRLLRGVGFYTRDSSRNDKNIVENLFHEGKLWTVVTTGQLAYSMSLDPDLVIIKGTQHWEGPGKGYVEYPILTLNQMIGRAGGHDIETRGAAVIMTQNVMVQRYSSSQAQRANAVSQVGGKLGSLLLEVFVKKERQDENTVAQGFEKTLLWNTLGAEKSKDHSLIFARETLQELSTLGLIRELESSGSYEITNKGKIVSENGVLPAAMQHVQDALGDIPTSCDPWSSIATLLLALAKICSRSQDDSICYRHGEKKLLEKQWKEDWMKFREPKNSLTNSQLKAYILLQAHVSRKRQDSTMLQSDMQSIKAYSAVALELMACACTVQDQPRSSLFLGIFLLYKALKQAAWPNGSPVATTSTSLSAPEKMEIVSMNGVTTIIFGAGKNDSNVPAQRIYHFEDAIPLLSCSKKTGQQWWTFVFDKRQTNHSYIYRHGASLFLQVPQEPQHLAITTIHEDLGTYTASTLVQKLK